MEDRFRSFIKSICWRVIAVLNGWGSAYFFIGDLKKSFLISLVANVIGFVLYYIHERVWNKIEWRRNEDR